jgi:alcohol dehydrogenase
MKTRAMVATQPGVLEMQEFPLPQTGDDDGILKLELIGICGSDPGIFKGKSARGKRPYPIILGHEIVGRIHQMGDAALKRHGLEIGDRVIVEYAFGCGFCGPCLSGSYTLCENFHTYGSMISCQQPPHLYGAYADYLYLPPRAMIHKISEDISLEEAVMICAVLGNGIRWLRQMGGASIGQPVVIIGPGQQGLAGAAVAKESGAGPIIMVGLSADRQRLLMAKRFGADHVIVADQEDVAAKVADLTNGAMAKLVMDVTGNPQGAITALSVAGLRSTIILPGIYGAKVEIPLALDKVVFNEIKLLGAFSHDRQAVEPAIKMAAKGKYPLAELVTHRLPLEEALKGLKLVAGEMPEENVMKVVLDPTL